jgi:hypothetical protein
MWQLLWDTIGYIMDSVPRWAKLTIFGLFVGVLYLFFGYKVALYVVGGMLWFVFGFLVIAHLVVVSRNHKKQREQPAPVPLTPADQADILEFQQAMEQSSGPAPTSNTANREQPTPPATQ